MSLETIAVFEEALRDPASVARDWQARGGKVVGVRCIYIPEEILWAGGLLPYPLYGTPEPVRLADAYFQSCSCELVRNVFDHALDGRLAFLDGVALANTCDAVRRLYDMWLAYVPGAPAYLLNHPQKLLEEGGRAFWIAEMDRFRSWAAGLAGRQIADGQIAEAIALYDESRRLLRGIYDLRRDDPPRLSGVEAFTVAMGATILPRDRLVPALRALLAEAREREAPDASGPRILVTGSLLDHPALIRMIEEEGGVVVADDLCSTSRHFWHEVGADGPPLEALWRFHNRRVLCACMHPLEARIDHLRQMARELDVAAVINFNLKYCHPYLYETPLVRKQLQSEGLPVHVLEIGHDHSGHGQLRTRIQAFIEMLDL